MLAQRYCFRRRRHAAHGPGKQPTAAKAAASAATSTSPCTARGNRLWALHWATTAAATAAGGLVDERQGHVDFGVLGKVLGVRQIERAARAVDTVVAGPQRVSGPVDVTQVEVGGIDEHSVARLGGHRESPQHGLRKRILDGLSLERIAAARSEGLISLNQQHAWADALEAHDASRAAAAAVEPDVVRSQAGRQPVREKKIAVEARDLQVHCSAAFVPVQREEAVHLLHAARPLVDRRRRP